MIDAVLKELVLNKDGNWLIATDNYISIRRNLRMILEENRINSERCSDGFFIGDELHILIIDKDTLNIKLCGMKFNGVIVDETIPRNNINDVILPSLIDKEGELVELRRCK